MLLLTCVVVLISAFGATAEAQRPKLDLSFGAGISTNTFVPRSESDSRSEHYPGFQLHLGARVSHRALMVKSAVDFRWWGVVLDESFVDDSGMEQKLHDTTIVGFALEVPWLVGYIPYENPYFKVHLYGGYVNQFNLKFRIFPPDDVEVRIRARDLEFPVYQAAFRIGTGFDVTLFHFDFNYSVGLNSATTTVTRTNLHVFQTTIALLF